MLVKFENLELNVVENTQHEWLLDTALVAEGYGVTPEAIRSAKSRKSDELLENKHFISVANCNGFGNQTFWTKRGVIRLGFFVRSKKAKKFRDWAEDLVVDKIEKKPLSPAEMFLQNAQMLVEIEQRQNIQERALELVERKADTYKELSDVRHQEVNAKLELLEAKTTTRPDYFTIVGYGTLNNISVNLKQASSLGRKASELCKQRGIKTDKIPDPRFGEVKMYPKEILEEVFSKPINQ